MNFLEFKNKIESIISNLQSFVEHTSLRDEMEIFKSASDNLKDLHIRLQNESFTVGVVGVFNSGKSTFLNALLGREIL
ncbi:MAG: ATP-binding protein, partial [Deltaproteobacteria bacterium]|nr:ATP-binding protein [Deltaproteobacteria bacterium]